MNIQRISFGMAYLTMATLREINRDKDKFLKRIPPSEYDNTKKLYEKDVDELKSTLPDAIISYDVFNKTYRITDKSHEKTHFWYIKPKNDESLPKTLLNKLKEAESEMNTKYSNK